MSMNYDHEIFYPEPARLPVHEKGSARAYKLPPAVELAERLRGGEEAETIAAENGITVLALQRRLNKSGFRINGRSIGERPAETNTAPLIYAPQEWMEGSACTQFSPELWYTSTPYARKAAIDICNTCPVRKRCLDYALEAEADTYGLPEGVWGGKTPTERRRMLKPGETAA